jgi:hypothetical protein
MPSRGVDGVGRPLVESFRTFGFAVPRRFFDPGPLAMEVDRVLSEGLTRRRPHTGDIRFQYVPMMTAETPASLSLLDRLGAVAETVFERPVLPTRAKGTRYFGESPWHVDSALPVESLGCLAYLESTGPDSGALRVMPGSHHSTFNEALSDLRAARVQDQSLPGHVLATIPPRGGDAARCTRRLRGRIRARGVHPIPTRSGALVTRERTASTSRVRAHAARREAPRYRDECRAEVFDSQRCVVCARPAEHI